MGRRLLVLGLAVSLWPGTLFGQRMEAKFDEFGNPIGEGFSLARDGEFRGKCLLAWSADGEVNSNTFPANNPFGPR